MRQFWKKIFLSMMVCAILASGGAAHETAAAAQTTGVKGTAQEVVKNGWNADRTIYYRNWKKYTGQRKIAGKCYLFKNGRLQKGFRTIQVNGKKLRVYYSRKTGEMLFGAQTIKGEKYYFNKRTGAMKTGWRKSGGKKYYYDEDGRMVTGHYLIGKTVYVFGDDGALTKTITRAKSKRATSAGKGTKTYTLIGMSTDEIIEKLGPLFTADQRKTGVLASVSMAQFILESWYGRSELALMANNCFGMKTTLSGNTWSGSKWDGKSVYKKQTKEEYTPGVKTTIVAIFRKYASIEDSIADHSAYLLGARDGTSLRYAGLKGCTSYRRAARIIKNGGYATDSTYVQQLCSIIKNLKLTRFDAKA